LVRNLSIVASSAPISRNQRQQGRLQ